MRAMFRLVVVLIVSFPGTASAELDQGDLVDFKAMLRSLEYTYKVGNHTLEPNIKGLNHQEYSITIDDTSVEPEDCPVVSPSREGENEIILSLHRKRKQAIEAAVRNYKNRPTDRPVDFSHVAHVLWTFEVAHEIGHIHRLASGAAYARAERQEEEIADIKAGEILRLYGKVSSTQWGVYSHSLGDNVEDWGWFPSWLYSHVLSFEDCSQDDCIDRASARVQKVWEGWKAMDGFLLAMDRVEAESSEPYRSYQGMCLVTTPTEPGKSFSLLEGWKESSVWKARDVEAQTGNLSFAGGFYTLVFGVKWSTNPRGISKPFSEGEGCYELLRYDISFEGIESEENNRAFSYYLEHFGVFKEHLEKEIGQHVSRLPRGKTLRDKTPHEDDEQREEDSDEMQQEKPSEESAHMNEPTP